MSISIFLRYFLLILTLLSVLTLGVFSCAKTEESETSTTDDTPTTTTTTTTTTTDPTTGVIYQAISVKKKPKDPSIKYTSLTAKPTATNLNFDNAQFGNAKFQ